MRSKTIRDPHQAREARKYENPIPSREYILALLQKANRPMTREALERALSLNTAEAQEALRRRLKAMRRDGQVMLTRKRGYGLVDKMDLIRGRVLGHKEGFGFIVPEDGSTDLFLSQRQMNQVFPEDRVLVRVAGEDRRGRREAAIVEVLERNTQRVVGRYLKEDGIDLVMPTNPRITQTILIPPDEVNEATHGQMVTALIIQQPGLELNKSLLEQRPRPALGRIVEVLGDHLAPGMGTEIAIRSYNLPYEWPPELEQTLKKLKSERRRTQAHDAKTRVDLRETPFVTIDGADARDFDDAVYCEPIPSTVFRKGGFRLQVAIADVSHYVQPNTLLDQEAEKRGNSVYFPSTTVPMLPELLSNDWCSLKPNVDRLALVCDMQLSAKGQLKHYRFYPALIRSQARLTYEAASRILASGLCAKHQEKLLPHLQNLNSLFQVLLKARQSRGAIDFEFQEAQVIFAKDGSVRQLKPLERTLAHQIIEECMLVANVAAAKFLLKAKIPTLFRIHEAPPSEKLADLKTLLGGLGFQLSLWRAPKPIDYARLLTKCRARSDFRLIQTALLRAMSQAVYSPQNKGHFGLNFSEYTHFTSPIRRYPDLIVHRAIYHALNQQPLSAFPYQAERLTAIGERCSMTERRADEATREVVSGLKREFMQAHLGARFYGIISHVTGFGFFVELEKILVEGLVHISTLKDDYYHFDSAHFTLRGERRGIDYRPGDRVRVVVARVDLDAREIDLELAS